MSHLKVRGDWLHWRNDPAYAGDSGTIKISAITSVFHSDGDSFVTVQASTGVFYNLENVTVDEVMTILHAETDRSSVEVVARQAERIAELEDQVRALQEAIEGHE